MFLTGADVHEVASAVNNQMDAARFELILTDFGLNPNDFPAAQLLVRVTQVFEKLRRAMPPRDGDLLAFLYQRGNNALRATIDQVRTPSYYPAPDPHRAILLGRLVFVDRDGLRVRTRAFTQANAHSTHVLVVRGEEPGGKSYSWEYLRHLACCAAGAQALRLRLRRTAYTPREFMEQVYRLLLLDPATLPGRPDEPQLAKIDPLMNAFKGRLNTLDTRFWLVVDDLNDPGVAPIIRDTAFALAQAVEEQKSEKLWLALLGYNDPITDPDLRHIVMDEAAFPTLGSVAHFLAEMAGLGGTALLPKHALETAQVLFGKNPPVHRQAMEALTREIEAVGEKLRSGHQL